MSSLSNSSTFYRFSSSSESENDIKTHFEFATAKINSKKTLQTSLASNLSRQTSNNSKRYIKKLKNKISNSNNSNTGLQNKYSTSPYTLRSLKNSNHVSTVSNNKNNKSTRIFHNKTISFSNSIDLNQIEFANAFESSSDSEFSNIKYLKLISKNKNIDTRIITSSSSNKDSSQSNSSSSITNKKQFTINKKKKNNMEEVKHLELLTSSSYDLSKKNIDTINFPKNDGYNDELNMDELLSDCSLSDILFVRDDGGARNSLLCPMPETDNLFLRMKSKSPEPLSSNISIGIDNISLPEKLSNVTINMPILTTDDNEREPNQFAEDIEMNDQDHVLINKYSKTNETESTILFSSDVISADSENGQTQSHDNIEMNEQEHILNNEYSKVNETDLSLHGVKLNKSGSISKSLKSIEENSSSELRSCSRCRRSNKIKNCIQNISYNNSGIDKTNKKQSKSKDSSEKTGRKISDFFQNKTSSNIDKTRNRRTTSTTNITEDIGLEYDTDKDNYLVELPNGAIVPSFLSTLKSKKVKKLCACGITSSQIPPSWSQSFHDILHLHLYKLRFKGNITDDETINIKENGLCYRIVILCADHYNDENIKTTVKNVDDFVCLEYGIPITSIKSYKHFTYLAVLPNFKIIGFLQAEPIHEAYTFTFDEQSSGHTVPVKFGISKIWVLVKYRNKNIDIKLMETFCEKEKLQKEDLAFLVDGCQGVQFIQEYTGNKNILIFNVGSA